MEIEFTVRLRAFEHFSASGLEETVSAATHAEAAEEAMRRWVERGDVGVDQMPVEAISKTELIEPHAKRFTFEPPPAFVMDRVDCCKFCGCTDEDACDPPCSWIEGDVCSAPRCVQSSGFR